VVAILIHEVSLAQTVITKSMPSAHELHCLLLLLQNSFE
jgi:hypothetical protein